MPIQPINRSDYNRIPDNEDVTPVDRTLSKNFNRTEKGVRCVVVVGVLLTTIATMAFFGYHLTSANSTDMISVYTTTKDEYSLNQLTKFTPRLTMKLFQRTSCKPSEDNQNSCLNNPEISGGRMTIDTRYKYQKILGFGGAFTESASLNYYRLPPEVRDRVLELYFGATGIGFTLGRLPINSCDFSPESYNFDIVENDYDLVYFDSEVTHDTQSMIPFILEAMAISKQPIRLVASPWSPPPWMKVPDSNGNVSMLGSASPNGLRNEFKVKLAWARYLSKFISAYRQKGINIWALTPQNEPEFPAPWEACAFNASFERDFISEFLGPVMRTEHPDVLILAFDHNKDHLKAWTEIILGNDSSSAEYVDGMAFHCK